MQNLPTEILVDILGWIPEYEETCSTCKQLDMVVTTHRQRISFLVYSRYMTNGSAVYTPAYNYPYIVHVFRLIHKYTGRYNALSSDFIHVAKSDTTVSTYFLETFKTKYIRIIKRNPNVILEILDWRVIAFVKDYITKGQWKFISWVYPINDVDILVEFEDYLDWRALSCRPETEVKIPFVMLMRHSRRINWAAFSKRTDNSALVYEAFADRLDWKAVVRANPSAWFMEKYSKYIL